MSLQTTWVQVPNTTPPDSTDTLWIDAYQAYPDTPTPLAAILVIQEVFGVNAHIRSVVDRLAAAGYFAIAPALYQRTAPGFAVGYTDTDLALGRSHKDQTTAPQLLSDLQATLNYLKHHPQINPHKNFGCIGFCFGGHVAYLAATLPDIQATASFYGAGITTFTPGGGPPTLCRTPDIHGTIYGFYGMQDPLIPLSHVDEIETALQHAHVKHKIFRYDNAGHGFCCDQRADYRPEACHHAWNAVMELFTTL